MINRRLNTINRLLSVNAFNKEEALARAFSGHSDCDTLRRIVYSSICSQRWQHHLASVYIAPALHLPTRYCHHSHRWNFDPTPTTTTTTTTAITFLAQLMILFGKTIFKLLPIFAGKWDMIWSWWKDIPRFVWCGPNLHWQFSGCVSTAGWRL